MNKKFLIVPIIILFVVIIGIGSQSNLPDKKNGVAFHVTLASPELYQNGVYTNTFSIEKGEYRFRFVPNGDSPQNLSISLKGNNFEFFQNFVLNGTLHETGFSEYYTWNYDGGKEIFIPTQNELSIIIDPNENLRGSVSVDLIRN